MNSTFDPALLTGLSNTLSNTNYYLWILVITSLVLIYFNFMLLAQDRISGDLLLVGNITTFFPRAMLATARNNRYDMLMAVCMKKKIFNLEVLEWAKQKGKSTAALKEWAVDNRKFIKEQMEDSQFADEKV